MKDRIQKNLHIRRGVAAEFAKISTILGLKEQDAAELALSEWTKKHHDEAQKRLDLYAEKGGVTINQPDVVNITVFQKADVMLAKEELLRLLEILQTAPTASRHAFQLELAAALKRVQPVYVRTRDPDLQQLIEDAEKRLDP